MLKKLLKEAEWSLLAKDRVKWCGGLMNTEMNTEFPKKNAWNFLTS
jgi:hypothetical protein